MTDASRWDRAALAVAAEGRRLPQVAALQPGLPTVQGLFDFMRDAELRFTTLRLRIVERAWTTHGEEVTEFDVFIRHPGHGKVMTSRPDEIVAKQYEIWISDGDLVRTYVAKHRLGTQRPIRNRPRGLDDPDIPGAAKVYEPVTALPMESLADTFVHPAGYCQNVLATGSVRVTGTDTVAGRAAITLRSDHPRATEVVGDRPDFAIELAVDRSTGIVLRLVETIGGRETRHAEASLLDPDAALAPSTFEFVFPTGTTTIY